MKKWEHALYISENSRPKPVNPEDKHGHNRKHHPGLLLACLIICLAASMTGYGQVGIGTSTPHASAQLELNAANRGFLPTRIALTSVNDLTTISSPATGLLVYNTATAGTSPANVFPGYYYYNGTVWVRVSNVLRLDDLEDAKTFDNTKNLGIGKYALNNLQTTGSPDDLPASNTAVGINAMYGVTSGSENTAFGNNALGSIQTGIRNVAIGDRALAINTMPGSSFNTAVGAVTLASGYQNTSIGHGAGQLGAGNSNVSIGAGTLAGECGHGDNLTVVGTNASIDHNYFCSLGPVPIPRLTNSTAIGYGTLMRQSNTVYLGNENVTDVQTFGKMKAKAYLSSGVALTSTTDVTTIGSPATGLLVYNTATAGVSPSNVTPGYYYFNGLDWSRMAGANKLDELEDASYDASLANMAIGSGSLINTISGGTNLAIGKDVLKSNVSGTTNLALGNTALYSNTTGSGNMALGWEALYYNVSGVANVALGIQTLYYNTGGNYNTGLGSFSLTSNTTGHHNEAIGARCLSYNTTGSENTAVGSWALINNGTGSYNVAVGRSALMYNATGNYNTAIGYQATVSTGNLTNATAIGYNAYVSASNTIQLGNNTITDVKTTGNITANGILLTSDARLKTNIEGIEGGLETLLRLRPYSYQKRSGFEPGYHEEKEYGFLAQDIREILPELVKEGNDPDKALTVNYTALIPILTKAIQEQQDKIDKQEAQLLEQQRQISELKEMISGRSSMKTKKNIVKSEK